ncbi:MAG: metallophosphoesterase, partial [Clostridia bacterium]|nr:metallophosphoesterase [Clostridia bacterium]
NIYAISDLHLSFTADKPMNIFGGNWDGHFEKIKSDWLATVKEEDIVLIAGDISWAMKMEDALVDLKALKGLPGKKVFIRGNHDYWWNGITKLRDSAPDDSFYFLQTDAVKIGEFVIVGSRGWTCPGSADYTEQDQKLYLREAERFRLALLDGEKLYKEGDKKIVMVHFPPMNPKKEDTLFTKQFEQNGVDKVVFGHIHGTFYYPLKTEKNGIEYLLTSCDKTDFNLVKIY